MLYAHKKKKVFERSNKIVENTSNVNDIQLKEGKQKIQYMRGWGTKVKWLLI